MINDNCLDIREEKGGLAFAVVVVPRSSRAEIVGLLGDALKVKLTAPPVEGAANRELIALLAKRIGVAKSAVHICSGPKSKKKRVRIDGISKTELKNAVVATAD